MKCLLVANMQEGSKRYGKDKVLTMLKAQIDNSLELLWSPRDIIVLSNFDFEFKGVKSHTDTLNDFCLTGSKMWGILWVFEKLGIDETVWAHDLDLWQNVYFDESYLKYGDTHFSKKDPNILDWDKYDVGVSTYSKFKFNGGGIFWKPSAKDIIETIIDLLTENNAHREEPTIDKVFKSEEYKSRIAVLSSGFNVGCSGFVPRYMRGIKPPIAVHLHPTNRIAWETHVLDRNGQDFRSVTPRLEQLLRRYYPNLATQMRADGIVKASEIRNSRYLCECSVMEQNLR